MAAATSSLGEQFREELTCSICLELFTRPKVLPCQHTFCQDCLEVHERKEGISECPNCRQQVELPPQGVAGLPDNHLVTSLCERLQNQATLSGETREQPQSGNRCSFHPSEEVKLYCNQCNVPVCNECLDEAHSDHGTISLKKASQERKAPVQAQIAEGRNILATCSGFLKSLGEKEKTLKEQKRQTDHSIMHAYDQTVQKLTERKDSLLSKADKHHRKNIEVLQKERNEVLGEVNELSATCDQAEQEMERGGLRFLSLGSSLGEMVQRCRGKVAPTSVQAQPASFHSTDSPVPVLGHVVTPVVFGGKGSEPGQFDKPNGLTVSDEGQIFVTDRANKRIQVFTLQGTFVQEFQRTMYGELVFAPHDVAMDGEGNLWVVGNAGSAHFAVQYDKQGSVLRTFDLQQTKWLRGVAVDTRRNHILITETTGDWPNLHGEVQVFRPDGTLVRTVGQQQGMKKPLYVSMGRNSNILVSDCDNNSVFVYDREGQFLFKFGQYLSRPFGICTDKAGNIIVADSGNNRVEQIEVLQNSLNVTHIPTDKFVPHAVAMAPQGQLVVTDIYSHTILIKQI